MTDSLTTTESPSVDEKVVEQIQETEPAQEEVTEQDQETTEQDQETTEQDQETTEQDQETTEQTEEQLQEADEETEATTTPVHHEAKPKRSFRRNRGRVKPTKYPLLSNVTPRHVPRLQLNIHLNHTSVTDNHENLLVLFTTAELSKV